jgi:hypothetical protein
MLRRVAVIRIDVLEECVTSVIRIPSQCYSVVVTANDFPSLTIPVTLMMGLYVSPKRRFLQEPHCVTSQKTAFFILTAVKTTNRA